MDIKGVFKTYIKKMDQPNFKKSVQYMKEFKKNNVSSNIVLYESFHGNSVSDNPYAIFKYLIENDEFKHLKHVWVYNGTEADNRTYQYYNRFKNVEFIKINSKEYLKYLTKSKYLINNTSFPEYFIPKENQVYINTWHGTPLKTLGTDMKGTINQHANLQRNFLKSDYIISPNGFTTEKLLDSHDIKSIFNGTVIENGYPRIDNTFKGSELLKKYLEIDLNIDIEKEIILYAPTWRGEVGNVSDGIEELLIDVKKINQTLKENQLLILKVHSLVYKYLIESDLKDVVIIPNWVDTNELLYYTDILITDYSSIFFDYLVTNKPILFYMYDKDQYVSERGVYLDIDSVPGPVSTTIEQLTKDLNSRSFEENQYREKYEEYKIQFIPYESGSVTSEYVKQIFDCNTKSVSLKSKKNILVYAGGFLNNGVTTSLINLSHNIDYNEYNLIIIDARKTNLIFQNNIKKLNSQSIVLYRSGLIQLTYKEWIEYNRFLRNSYFDSSKYEVFHEIADRELRRLVGNIQIDSVIDFSGYVPFWSLIFGLSSVPNKSIYQHNDMLSESEKVIKGKKIHKNNLDKIFSMYKYYDNIISVGRETLKLNQQNLSEFVEFDKMKYVPNSLDQGMLFKHIEDPKMRSLVVDNEEYLLLDSLEDIGRKMFNVVKPLTTEGKNFINIGRLSPEKDQKKLILAFNDFLNDSKNKNHQLYIVGSGILELELKNLVANLNLNDNIIFTGQIDNIPEFLSKMDCFISSSNHEGQPMTLLECLALKKDVIATNIAGNYSVLGNKYGYLVDNSIEGLSKALTDYTNNQLNFTNEFSISDYNRESMSLFYKCVND